MEGQQLPPVSQRATQPGVLLSVLTHRPGAFSPRRDRQTNLPTVTPPRPLLALGQLYGTQGKVILPAGGGSCYPKNLLCPAGAGWTLWSPRVGDNLPDSAPQPRYVPIFVSSLLSPQRARRKDSRLLYTGEVKGLTSILFFCPYLPSLNSSDPKICLPLSSGLQLHT